MKPVSIEFPSSFTRRLATRVFAAIALGLFSSLALSADEFPSPSWGEAPPPTSDPWNYTVPPAPPITTNDGGHVMAADVSGTIYSTPADDPDADAAVRNLAENMGNDP